MIPNCGRISSRQSSSEEMAESLVPKPTRRGFVEFHTRHKLLIMAHSPQHMRQMGKMIADIKSHSLDDFRVQYQRLLMDALRLKTTRRKNTDVLFHVMGFFKKQIAADEKRELVETIEKLPKGACSAHCAGYPTVALCTEIR